MKALVINDDLAVAVEANVTLQRATHYADAAVPWSLTPWRIDLLKIPQLANEALNDAADARLIVFAVRRPSSLPMRLIAWLERWATIRQTQEAALAILGGGNAKESLAQAALVLSQFARRHGISVISDDCGENDDKPKFLDSGSNECKSAGPPTPLRNVLNRAAHRA
jgi:hypothetical protein